MAYTRGETYIFAGQNHYHFWVKDGYDGWDEAGWSCDLDGNRTEGYEEASGTSISFEAIDAFVMMRLAEMVQTGEVDQAIDDAVNKFGGNFGCEILTKNADKLREALRQIKLEPVPPDENRKKNYIIIPD